MDEKTIDGMVRKMFAAFFGQDRQALEALLSDDFTFTSPNDDHIDKAAYFERCFPNSVQFKSHAVEQVFVKGDAAFARYVAQLKDGKRFHNVEYYQFADGKIRSVDVYFGAAESSL
ncbi:MAG: nuclear transport factor 2 family protein [Anaerolineae bacterium]|nr:nuclear transport factor 2 family protein [Anaerolineae bacterium]